MVSYWKEADQYFFGTFDKKKENSIYQTIIKIWIDLIEKNINQIGLLDDSFKKLENIGWLNDPPRIIFNTTIEENNKILFFKRDQKHFPKIIKIFSLMKNNQNYIDDIKEFSDHVIYLNSDTLLKPNDKIKLDILIISGHPTSAPIQRILRLKNKVLKNIIEKIQYGEKGNADTFWKNWKEQVKTARDQTGINIIIKE